MNMLKQTWEVIKVEQILESQCKDIVEWLLLSFKFLNV